VTTTKIRGLSFSRQFLLFGISVLVIGMVTIGLWVQSEIRRVFIDQTSKVTALYVDSFLAHHVQDLEAGVRIDAASTAEIDSHLQGTALADKIVTIKIWTDDGTIAYSTNPELTGRSFPLNEDLRRAFDGQILSRLTDLTNPGHEQERLIADLLLETYAPIHASGSDSTIAVAEFYQRPDPLLNSIRSSQRRGWVIVAAATVAMYLILVGLVRGASRLIRSQRTELENNVKQLGGLLAMNERLHARTRGAAGRVTALNERFLRRVSADLHDGPAQNVALASMRIAALSPGTSMGSEDLETIDAALGSALADIRSIAQGLRTPEIDALSPADTAELAVRNFERTTRTEIDSRIEDLPEAAPLSTRITVYRVIQEALANSYKHGGDAMRTMSVTAEDDALMLIIADNGPGFDPGDHTPTDSLGLAGMRERVEMLGGTFEIVAAPGEGTQVIASIPLGGSTDD